MMNPDHPAHSNVTQCARQHDPIVLGRTKLDADQYAYEIGLLHQTKIRQHTPFREDARGRIGPVFASPDAKAHPKYEDMLRTAEACGITCSCFRDHPERIA